MRSPAHPLAATTALRARRGGLASPTLLQVACQGGASDPWSVVSDRCRTRNASPAAGYRSPVAGHFPTRAPRLSRSPHSLQPTAYSLSRGFTLIEMIAVMAIIAMLVSSLVFTYNKAKSQARQTDCKSNLRQFGVAVLIYRSDHGSLNPPWMSSLYPDYVDSRQLFVCKSDPNHGLGRTRPAGLTVDDTATKQNYSETVDNVSNAGRPNGQNPNVSANSYSYEFSAAPTSWYVDGNQSAVQKMFPNDSPITWGDNKEYQLLIGDSASMVAGQPQPYSTSRMPIIRCYQHWKEGHVRGYANQQNMTANLITDERITLNVAYAGNVYVGPLWWEGTIQPGDTNNVTQ